jgi:uncharacterized RDD family membrane protein YckC
LLVAPNSTIMRTGAGAASGLPLPRANPHVGRRFCGSRAGFWRRVFAFIIDIFIVAIPFELLVVGLYVQTNGGIQTTSGIALTHCVSVRTLPADLYPSPPANPNFARDCRYYFFDFETAHTLTAGRAERQGNVTTSVWRTYTLGPDGRSRNAISLDWVVFIALIVYLVTMERRFGATLGKRFLNIRVITRDDLSSRGIPLRRAIIRQLSQWIGAIPGLSLVLFIVVAAYVWDLDRAGDMLREAMTGNWGWALLLAAVGLTFVWFLWIIVDVVRKRDPIYGRIAGTAVVPA